jgi:hypothetical protein
LQKQQHDGLVPHRPPCRGGVGPRAQQHRQRQAAEHSQAADLEKIAAAKSPAIPIGSRAGEGEQGVFLSGGITSSLPFLRVWSRKNSSFASPARGQHDEPVAFVAVQANSVFMMAYKAGQSRTLAQSCYFP